ncbi:heparinase II/III family protein [Paenibacillus sp. IB182496]|uniref:Heparinase II/III family protein n=1 Tax=Paenibacillus sabuli TaxID=2772509 RepID=A0A927BXI8_9BACL|nr:heparinase II/III family protein [Paenibacillus sabuli]MBD2847435.1 heparinase II/III family protein [Paenibacillus sabuli]
MYSRQEIYEALPMTPTRPTMVARPPAFPYGAPLTRERLAELKDAEHLQPLLTEIRVAAQQASRAAVPALPYRLFRLFEQQGTRAEYEAPYFERRGQLLVLTLQLLLEQDCAADSYSHDANLGMTYAAAPTPEAHTSAASSDAPSPETHTSAASSEAPTPEAHTSAASSDAPSPETHTSAASSEAPSPEAHTSAASSEAPTPETASATPPPTSASAEARQPLEALEDLLWEICNEYTWCLPACLPGDLAACLAHEAPPEQMVDLFAAETAHALAETLWLIGDRLSPWIVHRVRGAIEARVFHPLFERKVRFAWRTRRDNWAAVCGGAVGMTLLLLEQDRERLADRIADMLEPLACFLEGYGADGGCGEGVSYWQYGFGYYVYFADMLAQLTAGRLDLLRQGDPAHRDKIRRIAAYPAASQFSAGQFVLYADAWQLLLHPGLLSRLKARLGTDVPYLAEVPDLRAEDCYRWPHVTRNLLWTDPGLLGRPVRDGQFYFADLGYLVARRGGLAFSAKGGHNAEPHNHNDLGQFILHVGGESLLADPGGGPYTRNYFGPARYTLLHPSSEGHSVPLVNGLAQQDGRRHAARVLHHMRRADGTRFQLELASAYADDTLRSLERDFVWTWSETGGATLVLTDRFRFSKHPRELEERLISLHEPLGEPGHVTWRGRRGEVALHYDARQLDLQTEAVQTADHSGAPLTVYRTRLAVRPEALARELTCRLSFHCALQAQGETAAAAL